MLKQSKSGAKKRGIEHTLKIEDIVIPEVCPVFKTPFVKKTNYTASIDRINNTKGYHSDNIQIISKLANTMKSNATVEELQKFAIWILKEYPL